MFANEAEKILKMTSQNLGEATENNPEAMTTICNNANFTEYIFKCRAKMDSYNVSIHSHSYSITQHNL